MKITEEKHNHKLTNLLKVFIFSVLMILPFLNVAVRCGYVMLNKNAYQSYYGETINDFKDRNVDSFNDLKVGSTYVFTSYNSETVNAAATKRIFFSDIEFISEPQNSETWIENMKIAECFTTTYYDNIAFLIPIVNGVGQQGLDMNSRSTIFTFKITNILTPSNYTYTQCWDNFLSIREYNSYSYLDNVFEYSLNKLENEQYLTWTQNTAVYQGVETMTTQLGITQTIIPMLIVYWFMLTIIYVIIDIVLALFTKLTHMIGNKTT